MTDERQPWVSRAVLETVGIALCIALIGGISSLFHIYNAQQSLERELEELKLETQRQWAQVFQIKEDIYNARLDFYRTIYSDPASVESLRRYRSEREIHKPER